MVWSPFSNLALYGETAAIAAAKACGLRIGIGPDWSPMGKNLLGELKVARLVSAAQGGIFAGREIVALATRNAAAILGWDRTLGTIEAGKRADPLVLAGKAGDPYARLLESSEAAIGLVTINGIPRYGTPGLMGRFGPGTESWRVAGRERLLNLAQETADPAVGALTLRAARDRLAREMRDLPRQAALFGQDSRILDSAGVKWYLLLDHDELAGEAQRPYLLGREAAAIPGGPWADVAPLELDPLTVVDDPGFLDRISGEQNLPVYIREELAGLYQR